MIVDVGRDSAVVWVLEFKSFDFSYEDPGSSFSVSCVYNRVYAMVCVKKNETISERLAATPLKSCFFFVCAGRTKNDFHNTWFHNNYRHKHYWNWLRITPKVYFIAWKSKVEIKPLRTAKQQQKSPFTHCIALHINDMITQSPWFRSTNSIHIGESR